ncbi:YjeJ family protein, partial [Salmonella enterica subsp. enterica serovar Anatum]|nr:YjeJ family protein [Salmonella enterica subsp. enterica serovar Anatum]
LRDLLIGLEHRLYLQHSLPEQEQEKRQKAKSSHVLKMHENIPEFLCAALFQMLFGSDLAALSGAVLGGVGGFLVARGYSRKLAER